MKILMIDDEPSRWKLIEGNNSSRTITPYSAHGFEQIQFYLSRTDIKFDLILLDHDMPLMNGVDVCLNFLIDRSIPVIIISNNQPAAEKMMALLNEYEVPVYYRPITNPSKIANLIRNMM